VSGKENIKIANRLLFESEVIKTVDKHTNDENQLDNDISCILEEAKTATVELPPILLENKVENKPVKKTETSSVIRK
jgi:hypothetical protein